MRGSDGAPATKDDANTDGTDNSKTITELQFRRLATQMDLLKMVFEDMNPLLEDDIKKYWSTGYKAGEDGKDDKVYLWQGLPVSASTATPNTLANMKKESETRKQATDKYGYRSPKSDYANGFKNDVLLKQYVDGVKGWDDGEKAMAKVYTDLFPTAENWVQEQKLLKTAILTDRNATSFGVPAFTALLSAWNVEVNAGAASDVKTLNTTVNGSKFDVAAAVKDYQDTFDTMMDNITRTGANTEEGGQLAMERWTEQEKARMTNIASRDSLYQQQIQEKLGKINNKNTEQALTNRHGRVSIAKMLALINAANREMKKKFRDIARQQTRADAKQTKKDKKKMVDRGKLDEQGIKRFRKTAKRAVSKARSSFGKSAEAVEENLSDAHDAARKGLHQLTQMAMRLVGRSTKVAANSKLDGLAAMLQDASAVLHNVDVQTKSAARQADQLTTVTANNLKEGTLFRISEYRNTVDRAVDALIQDVGQIVEETVSRAVMSNLIKAQDVQKLIDNFAKRQQEAIALVDGLHSNQLDEHKRLSALKMLADSTNALLMTKVQKAGRHEVEEEASKVLAGAMEDTNDLVQRAVDGEQAVKTQRDEAESELKAEFTEIVDRPKQRIAATLKAWQEELDKVREKRSDFAALESSMRDVRTHLAKAVDTDLPEAIDHVNTLASGHRSRTHEEFDKVENGNSALMASTKATLDTDKATFDTALAAEQEQVAAGQGVRSKAISEGTAKINAEVTSAYDDFVKEQQSIGAKAAVGFQGQKASQRTADGVDTDLGPGLTGVEVDADRVERTGKEEGKHLRQSEKDAYERLLGKAKKLLPPVVNEKVEAAHAVAQEAKSDLATQSKAVVEEVRSGLSGLQKAADGAADVLSPLDQNLKMAGGQFTAQELAQTSASSTLNNMVQQSLEDAEAAAAGAAQDDADESKKVDAEVVKANLDAAAAADTAAKAEKARLEQALATARAQLAAADSQQSPDGAAVAAAQQAVADLERSFKKAEEEATATEEALNKLAVDNSEEVTKIGNDVEGAEATEASQAQDAANEGVQEIDSGASAAIPILGMMKSVRGALTALRASDETRWKESKEVAAASSHSTLQKALAALAGIEDKHNAIVETSKERGKELDGVLLGLDADYNDTRRAFRSSQQELDMRLATEQQNLDHDAGLVGGESERGADHVAELATKTAAKIEAFAVNTTKRMADRESAEHGREKGLAEAEHLSVAADEDAVLKIAAEVASTDRDVDKIHSSLHSFASGQAAFKEVVRQKLVELGYENAELDANELRQASKARLGIVDARNAAEAEIDQPIRDAQAAAERDLAQVYADMDQKIFDIKNSGKHTKEEQARLIADLKAKAKAKADKIHTDAARLRAQEVALDAEMGRYQAAVEAKRNLLQGKIQAGLLSPSVAAVHDQFMTLDTRVHKASREGVQAAANLRTDAASLVQVDSAAQVAQQTQLNEVADLEAMNDRLEVEDDALETRVQALERSKWR